MGRREGLERKQEKREEWSRKAAAKADGHANAAHEIGQRFEFGQPILVGHHSEGRARRDHARMDSNMQRSVEASAKAKDHASKAAGLQRQLDRTIFSDDDDAIEALTAKVEKLEAERARMRRINAAHKKGGLDAVVAAGMGRASAERILALNARCGHNGKLFPAYEITNLGAKIRAAKKRIKEVAARQEKVQAAVDAGGVLVVRGTGGAVVTFAEYPGRDTVSALKAAGFHWSAPSWYGPAADLPEGIGE